MRVVVALHYYTTGPGQELHEWLKSQGIEESLLIEHPFPFSARDSTRVETFRAGHGATERQVKRRRWPMFVRYALDFVRTLCLVLSFRGQWDVYVGNGCFDTLPGLVLKLLGKVRLVVLYTIDYAPNAAGSRLYAWAYRRMDRLCCYHTDAIWDLSHRMLEARVRDGVIRSRCAHVEWVPHGSHTRTLRPLLPARASPQRLAFLGHIQEKSGVQLIVETMPEAMKEFTDLSLDVLGDGPYRPCLEALVVQLGLSSRVRFHGYIQDHREAERILSECGIGLALYNPEISDFSSLADPGKPKIYLACGLPVVIVDVPEVAEIIEQRGAGKKITYKPAALLAAVREIIRRHDEFRANALKLADEFDWDAIFSRAWSNSFAGPIRLSKQPE